MSEQFVFLFMIFCHILDDYVLQGILASMKQREWWKENAPNPMYEWDYVVALVMHSMEWSFMIMLPIAIYFGFSIGIEFCVLFVSNTLIHAIVDDLKANKLKINLVTDQTVHMMQIVATFLTLVF